jgi:membrane-bound lytic murein transglycosylase D
MEYKGTNIQNKETPEPKKNSFREHDISPWDLRKRKKINANGLRVFPKQDTYWLWLVLLIISIVILGSTIGVNVSFYTRLRHLEKDVHIMKDMDEKIKRIQEQDLALQMFKNRLDHFEETTTGRLDNMVSDLNSLRERPLESQAPGPVSSGPEIIDSEPRVKSYHTVQQGETLYTISRMHGLTVNEIKMKNGLSDSAVIYPGQKIFIGQ